MAIQFGHAIPNGRDARSHGWTGISLPAHTSSRQIGLTNFGHTPDESYAIRGALYEVYREIGNGLREEVYQQCFEREFALRFTGYRLGLLANFGTYPKMQVEPWLNDQPP